MKKFHFSLNTVLSYQQQRLDLLQGEHALILSRLREAEQRRADFVRRYQEENETYQARCQRGVSILEVRFFESKLRAMEQDIAAAEEQIRAVRAEAERKRTEVVEAKQDAASIEKLKEKKRDAYNKASAKDAELAVEEFVSSVQTGKAGREAGL